MCSKPRRSLARSTPASNSTSAAAFTSQVQALEHENAAQPLVVSGVNTNQLADIDFGFNNSTANVYLHAELAEGIRVQLTSYLSSRHHNETWVKDGFILIDQLPVDLGALNNLMQYATIRVGHFEINYGDAHFCRSDNGNAMFNPFVGNYLMDAFTTEIGGEVYLRAKGMMLMGAVTGGEIRGASSPQASAVRPSSARAGSTATCGRTCVCG